MSRVPNDPERWTGIHSDKCIEDARRKFARYEARVNFEYPELTDNLYRKYQIARQLAVDVARYTRWRYEEADNLP